ncbi:MAG TPA: histidine phosphatase family protein [Candidatus Paceibacterota bacterium]
MKTVYFVRHGQSHGNASFFHQQTGDTTLTPYGITQAKEVAHHMKKLPLETIVSSTFSRARSTAEELGRETGLSVEHSDLFVERRRPGVQLRKKKVHPHWHWVQLQLVVFGRRAGYRHSDEESAEELLSRAHAALAYLLTRPESVIAVVTHSTFMRALYACMIVGEGVTGRTYLRATWHMHTKNTALMIAVHDSGAWDVKAWNVDAKSI